MEEVKLQVILHLVGKELIPGQDLAAVNGRVEAPVLTKGSVMWPSEQVPGAKDLCQSVVLEVVRSRAKDAHPGGSQRRRLCWYSLCTRGAWGCRTSRALCGVCLLGPLTA